MYTENISENRKGRMSVPASKSLVHDIKHFIYFIYQLTLHSIPMVLERSPHSILSAIRQAVFLSQHLE